MSKQRRKVFFLITGILLISALLAPAQDIKLYSRLTLAKYRSELDSQSLLIRIDNASTLPMDTLTLLMQGMEQVYTRKSTNDSIHREELYLALIEDKIVTVEVVYIKFQRNIVNGANDWRIMDNVFGPSLYGTDSINVNEKTQYYLGSVLIKEGNDTVVYFNDVRPLLFGCKLSRVAKVLEYNQFYLEFEGSLSSEAYSGFLLLDSKGQRSMYINHGGVIFPWKVDLLSQEPGNHKYIIIDHPYILSAKALAAWGLHMQEETFEEAWQKYWAENSAGNLRTCMSLDLSQLLRSDSLFGSKGAFENDTMFVFIANASKDAKNSLLYHISGLWRIDQTIRNFIGIVEIKYVILRSGREVDGANQFIVYGEHVISDMTGAEKVGEFTGTFLLWIDDYIAPISSSSLLSSQGHSTFSSSYLSYSTNKIQLCSWFAFRNYYWDSFNEKEKGWWKKMTTR